MREIPDYGDHMTVEDFRRACMAGAFIDDDGFGVYATAAKMTDIPASPSNFLKGIIDDRFTHVVWFNK